MRYTCICKRIPAKLCVYLQEAGELGIPEGDMGRVGVRPGIDAHPQGSQGQVDALGL